MGYSTQTLQTMIDISNKIDKALKEIELPEGYTIEMSINRILYNKNLVNKTTVYPSIKQTEPHIELDTN